MSDTNMLTLDHRDEMLICAIDHESFDHTSTEQFRMEATDATADMSQPALLLDMNRVKFVPSLMIGALVEIATRLKQSDKKVVLVGLAKDIEDTMKITGILQLFDVKGSLEECL
ncbi:MAG: STAS domain-containing protein [Phycisphaerae bacterium]